MPRKAIPPYERKGRIAQKNKSHHEKRYEILLERVKNLPEEDRRIMLKFDRKITAQGVSFGRKSIYLSNLIEFRKLFGKGLAKVSQGDIERVLADLARKPSGAKLIASGLSTIIVLR